MKKLSVLLVAVLLFNIAFSATIFAQNESTEELQMNNFINYAEEDGVLPAGWANNDNNNENTMLKLADSENEGEQCLAFDCSAKTGRINATNFTNQSSGKLLLEARVSFTKKSGLSLYFTGTSDAVRPGVTLYQDGYGLDDGQWHDMRIIIDISNGTIAIGYDGAEPVVKVQDITFSYGVQRFYFANWSLSNSVVSFQNLDVYKYYTEAKPVKFSAKTVLNDTFDFQDGDTVKSGINKIDITFDTAISSIGTDLITLQMEDEGTYQTISTTPSVSGKKVTLECAPLIAGKDYRIFIDAGIITTMNITSEEQHEIFFATDEGSVGAQLVKNTQGGIIESYITTYENTFSNATDFSVTGVMGSVKGLTFIRDTNIDTTSGYLTISPARGATSFEVSYGDVINAGDFVTITFRHKAPDTAAEPSFLICSGTGTWSTFYKFDGTGGYCDGDAFIPDEWQTYTIEIYPSTNTDNHKFKLYRGDNGDSATLHSYSNGGTNTTGIRIRSGKTMAGEANYQYFDDVQVKIKKAYIAETFTETPTYKAEGSNLKSALVNTSTMMVSDGVLMGTGTEVTDNKLLYAELANAVSGTATEVYFRAKLPADKVSLKVGNAEYLLSDDTIFGGDDFSADTWQKYHIVMNGDTAKLWRGEATQYTQAISHTFSDASVRRAILQMVDDANGDVIELDDFSWTIYEQGVEPVRVELPNSVTATIQNTTAESYRAYIIYSEYSDTYEMLGTKYQFVEVPANDEQSFTMNFAAPNSDSIGKAYAYLWQVNSSVPLCEMVTVK